MKNIKVKDKNQCLICGSNLYSIIYKFNNANLLCCKECNFIYITPIPHSKKLNNYYESFEIDNNLDIQSRIINDSKRALFNINRYVKSGKIIDCGAGQGHLLNEAKKIGWKIDGIELSINNILYAKNVYNINLRKGDIYSVDKIATEKYNVAILNQVIEHLENPKLALKAIGKILVDNGLLYIATPNIESLSFLIEKEKFDYLLPKEHLGYYSVKTLNKLLNIAGYKIIYCSTWSYRENVAGIIKTLLRRNNKKDSNLTDFHKTSTKNNSIITNIKYLLFDKLLCSLLTPLLSINYWGINIEVIAIKI